MYKTKLKIDSLRIVIDISLIKNYDIPNTYIINSNGEIIKEFKKLSGVLNFTNKDNHKYKLYYLLHRYRLNKNYPEQIKFIILLSSKINAKKYLEDGLTYENILFVFEELNRLNILELKSYTKKTFAEIDIKDLDICFDVSMTQNEVLPLLKRYDNAIKQGKSKKLAKGSQLTNRKNSQMLQVNRREQSTFANPFFKIYNKTKEFEFKTHKGSETIYSIYGQYFNSFHKITTHELKPSFNKNLNDPELEVELIYFDPDTKIQYDNSDHVFLRYEYTIRNYIDFEKYKLQHKLFYIFHLKQNKLIQTYNTIVDQIFYLDKIDTIVEDKKIIIADMYETLNPNDVILCEILTDLIYARKKAKLPKLNDYDIERYVKNLLYPNAKTRQRKKLYQLVFSINSEIDFKKATEF